MNIIMKKIKEDSMYVEYLIETEIPTGTAFNSHGREYVTLRTGNAYCKFNKSTEELSLDLVRTDPYFSVTNSRIIKAKCKLMQIARSGESFSDLIQLASG